MEKPLQHSVVGSRSCGMPSVLFSFQMGYLAQLSLLVSYLWDGGLASYDILYSKMDTNTNASALSYLLDSWWEIAIISHWPEFAVQFI